MATISRLSLYTLFLAGAASVASAGTITGQVTDATGFRTLQGAEVELVEASRRTSVETDGRYRFTNVAPGRYTLRFHYSGTPSVERSVEVVAAGSTVQVDAGLGDDSATALESVLVVGQRASLSGSLSRQRAADIVQSVLTRDAIGQFPDQNVAESVRRVTGVNVLNDQGEGRFIAVRGLSPDLNAASINGARVPAPEADVRSVALDVVPAELIESIEIRKSLTPDMDADTLGASIEINTASSLERREPYIGFTAQGTFNDLTASWSPKGSVDFSTRLTERLGMAGGVSYYRRRFATDNIETEGWSETDDGLVYADTVEYRDYDVERTRLGASLGFDFQANDSTTLYARGLVSDFEDQEFRSRLTFELDEEPASGVGTTVNFRSDDGRIRVERDIKDRFETQRIASLVLGGETLTGPWVFKYRASRSTANEKENGSLDPTQFRRDYEEAGELDLSFDNVLMTRPAYAVGTGLADFLDPASYEFEKIERTTRSLSEDEENAFQLDVTRQFIAGEATLDLQGGVKLRQRDKSYDLALDVFDGYDDDLTLADVLGRPSYGITDIGPQASWRAVRSLVADGMDGFERNTLDSDFESAVADYAVSEDITAGYLLGRYDTGALRMTAGVRMEHTDNDIAGNLVELVEEGATHGGAVLEDDTVFVTASRFQRSYFNWLPSLNIRYQAAPQVILRAAAYSSVVRPGIGDLAPRFIVEESDDGEREGEFGNPDLKPYEAVNFDASAEWYFASNAVLQLGLFRKDIDNFIARVMHEDVTFNGVFAHEASIPLNGDSATVNGLELGYQQAMTFLPAPFDGLILGFNFTYTDSEARIDGRTIALPASSERTANLSLGYDKGPFSFRLVGAYRSAYLDELGESAEEDRYVKSHLQWDLSAKYRITPQLQVFAELVNITDEPYVAYQNGPGAPRLRQYEEYSWTGILGFRMSL